jgi:hypothetical protein
MPEGKKKSAFRASKLSSIPAFGPQVFFFVSVANKKSANVYVSLAVKFKYHSTSLTMAGDFIYIPCGLKGTPVEGQFASVDFVHPILNKAVRTISGHYILSQEKRLPYNGREVLYFIGCAVVDASCCGPGGCAYALVQGFIKQWKYKLTPDNRSVTQVEVIRNKAVQKELRRLIKEKEPVQQVDFQS